TAMQDVLGNIILYKRVGEEVYNRIFVVSAYAGVTNWLLENKKTGEPGVYHIFKEHGDYKKSLLELTDKLKGINKKYVSLGLNLEEADAFIEQRVIDATLYLD